MDNNMCKKISFLKSAYSQTKETGKPFPMDGETIKGLIDLLESKEEEISFLKGMQLQTITHMSDEDIGRAVLKMIGR